MNIGASTNLLDQKPCSYKDRLMESVTPMSYKLDPIQISNCKECLSITGPRGNEGGSTVSGDKIASSQHNVDVESILTNRNVKLSKCKKDGVNPEDVTKYDLKHTSLCNDYLTEVPSRLTNPLPQYRGVSINRFYDLIYNPQRHIFYNFSLDTKLKAKDEYVAQLPKPLKEKAYPIERKLNRRCKYSYTCN